VLDLILGIYTFQLKVTDNNGATGTKTVKVIVRNRNGNGGSIYCTLYPNPSHDNLNLQFLSNQNGKYRISLYDARRRLIRDMYVEKNQVTLSRSFDVSNLRNGIYHIVIVLPDGKRIARTFIKM
jgi:hypothetical protein